MNVSLNEAEIARLVAERISADPSFRSALSKQVLDGMFLNPELLQSVRQGAINKTVSEVRGWADSRVKDELRGAIKETVRRIVNDEVGSAFRLVAGKMATKLAADAGMLFEEDKKENKFLVKDILNKPRD